MSCARKTELETDKGTVGRRDRERERETYIASNRLLLSASHETLINTQTHIHRHTHRIKQVAAVGEPRDTVAEDIHEHLDHEESSKAQVQAPARVRVRVKGDGRGRD